jgi:biopolymer transport protein ExbD
VPPKTLVKAGIAVVTLATLLAWISGYWMRTRSFDALDAPITTSEGHWRTEPFRINVKETFSIRIETDEYAGKEKDPCPPAACLLWTWQLYRWEGVFKREWKESDNSGWQLGQGPWLGWFEAKPGSYVLDVKLLRGGDCLNARHPRLLVWSYSRDFLDRGKMIYILCVFLLGTGVVLILRGGRAWMSERAGGEEPPRIFPGMPLRNALALQRHRRMPLIGECPNFGIIWGSILYILWVIFATGPSVTPRGLWMDFKQVRTVGVAQSPWTEMLGVYVDGQRQFYINGQKVGRVALGTKLKKGLGRRAGWTVYFEAAPDDPFMDAAYVIDTVQGLGAKVIWITPKMREALKQEAAGHGRRVP